MRTVRDAAAALDAVAGYMPGDPWTAPIAVPSAPGGTRRGWAEGRFPVCTVSVMPPP